MTAPPHSGWIVSAAVPVLLVGYAYRTQLRSAGRVALVVLAGLVAMLRLAADANVIAKNIARPPEWDLQWFWIQGRVAAAGLNFYDPAHAQAIAVHMHAGQAFLRELYFWYPPPTMLLFAGLGRLDIHHAVAAWYLVLGMALVADIVLLQRCFLREDRVLGLAVASALTLSWAGTTDSIVYGQTNFIVLLVLLLAWRDRLSTRSGAWLAAGAFVKPFVAIVLLYHLVLLRWRALFVAAGAFLAAFAIATVAFGPATVRAYFVDNPVRHAPASLYDNLTTQSLLAFLLRHTGSPATARVAYVIAASILLLVTALVLRRIARSRTQGWGLGIPLCVTLALLLYPATLGHYSVALLLPLFALWRGRGQFAGGAFYVAGLTGVVAVSLNLPGEAIFAATLLTWLSLVAWVTVPAQAGSGVGRVIAEDRA